MQQAKARNPNIKLYGLAWGAPGWIGSDLLVHQHDQLPGRLAGCAKPHSLTDRLPRRLERARLQHQLVREPADHAERRRVRRREGRRRRQRLGRRQRHGLRPDVQQRGGHRRRALPVRLPVQRRPPARAPRTRSPPASRCGPARTARRTSTPARRPWPAPINRDYIDGKMTAYINWPLIAAIYPNLPFNDRRADRRQPAVVRRVHDRQATWVTAQTTQFTAPGWNYIDSASGYLGGNRSQRQLRHAEVDQRPRLQHGHRDHGRHRRADGHLQRQPAACPPGTVHVWAPTSTRPARRTGSCTPPTSRRPAAATR